MERHGDWYRLLEKAEIMNLDNKNITLWIGEKTEKRSPLRFTSEEKIVGFTLNAEESSVLQGGENVKFQGLSGFPMFSSTIVLCAKTYWNGVLFLKIC